MSESEKPLHVRVAEALGWTNTRPPREHETHGQWVGEAPERDHWGADIIPHFPESWRHTGPLIEKYGIGLMVVIDDHRKVWRAYWDRKRPDCKECGATYRRDEVAWPNMIDPWTESPLIAVCNLILALKAAGKLA